MRTTYSGFKYSLEGYVSYQLSNTSHFRRRAFLCASEEGAVISLQEYDWNNENSGLLKEAPEPH